MPRAASRARYDGLADWYDSKIESATYRQRVLRDHLVPGAGPCLDIGCGTGRDLQISRVVEPGDEPAPHSIVVAATTP